MVIVTGVQSSEEYHPFHPDDIMPPRSIFDPPDEAEDEELSEGGGGWEGGDPGDAGPGGGLAVDTATVDLWSVGGTLTTWETRDTRDTRDTFSTGLGSPGRRRLRHKHPASLNEVELRIQLWDSYRLARIILGTPIKSFSLRGKTILHSIRKVAEMKLELIRLEKELEMAKVLLAASEQEQQHQLQHQHSMHSLDTLETPQKKSCHTPSRIDLALVSPERAKDDNYHHPHHPDQHDEEEDLPGMATPRRQTRRLMSPTPTLDMVQIQYEQLQETHDQTMKDFHTQLSVIKTHLETTTTTKSVPSFETVDSTEDVVDGTQPTTQQPATVVVSHTNKTKKTKTKKNDGGILSRAFRKSSHPPPEPFNRAEDTLEAVAAVARDHDINNQSPEELHLRTLLAKKSNSVRTLVRSTEPTPADERAKLLQLVEQLMARVEESSQETKLQFDALQQQLELYSSQGMTAVGSSSSADGATEIFTQQQFQQKLQTARILHKLELETSKSKHIQQVVDLSGQLDAYQNQVDKQNNELQKWRKKFQHLEEMAVTPEEAKDALKELDNLPPHATPDQVAQVQAKVVRVLQRMAQLQTRQQTEQRLMQKTRQQAQAKEAESEYQLEDLKLQHEMLKEDTEVPPEVWERQLGTQRRAFEQEMKDLFKREERRMREMELLEVRLTELAFLAVEVEDLELECRQSQEVFSHELTKAQDHYTSTTPMIQALQSQVEHVLLTQRRALQGLKSSWKRTAEIHDLEGRLKDWTTTESPEVLLHRRDEELREVQATLAIRESRIQELEAMVCQLQSEKSP